jgi:hypothetical protein
MATPFYPGMGKIEVGGNDPMAGVKQSLGGAVAGIVNGPANLANAESRGAYLGAQTLDAMSQARQRQQDYQSGIDMAKAVRDPNSPIRVALPSVDQGTAEGIATQIEAAGGAKTEETIKAGLGNLAAAHIQANSGDTGSMLASQAPAAAIESVKPNAEGSPVNPLGLNVAGGPQNLSGTQAHTAATTADANASAGLKINETQHPELYHPNMGLPQTDMTMDNPGWAAHIDAVGLGKVPPTPTSGRTAAMGVAEQRDVMAKYPNFTGYQYKAGERAAVTTEGQTATNTDNSINRVAGHIDILRQATAEMRANNGNGDVTPSNELKAKFHELFGSAAPTTLNLVAQAVATEAMKSAAGANAGSVEERNNIHEGFASSRSPEQYDQNTGALVDLVKRQADSRAIQERNAQNGVDNYYQRKLDPVTRKSLGIDDKAQVQGKYVPRGQPGVAAPTSTLSEADQAMLKRLSGGG